MVFFSAIHQVALPVHKSVLYALISASGRDDEEFLLESAIPAVLQLSWVDFRNKRLLADTVEWVGKWSAPILAKKTEKLISKLLEGELRGAGNAPPGSF